MPIPDYQTLMRPLLQLAADGQEHKLCDATLTLAAQFQLSEAERTAILPSGTQSVFGNRVGWARSYLKQAGALYSPRRGYFVITARGQQLLNANPVSIRIATLAVFPEFQDFKNRRHPAKTESGQTWDMDSEVIFDDIAGALQGQRAKKGIFMTTSSFSREAKEYARSIETRIILIDGEKLAALMVEYNVGVSVVEHYEVKKVDTDYFEGG